MDGFKSWETSKTVWLEMSISSILLRIPSSAEEDDEEFLERISKMLQEMTPDCEAGWIPMEDVVVEA